jgi:2-dehydropantoate 2-reductase
MVDGENGKLKFLVFGAGALGSFFGAMLARSHQVVLIGRKEHVATTNADGLQISGKSQMHIFPRAYENLQDMIAEHEISGFDYLLLTVKSYDTRSAMKDIVAAIQERDMEEGNLPYFVSFQNGLGNEEIMMNLLGPGKGSRVIGGVTSHGLTFLFPAHIYHAGEGETVIGAMHEDGGEGKEGEDGPPTSPETLGVLADALTDCGITTRVSDNIRGEIWAKAIVNAGINPLTAITGLKNGALLEDPLSTLSNMVCREAIQVARACDVNLPDCDLIKKTRNVIRLTAENHSSMLQDILKRRRTEVDNINGRIAAWGASRKLETPLNCSLHALVKGIEKRRRESKK